MFCYIPTEESLYNPEIGVYTTYGIRALEFVANEQSQRSYVSDVTPDLSVAQSLCARFNQYQLDPAQLSDAVDDFLSRAPSFSDF